MGVRRGRVEGKLAKAHERQFVRQTGNPSAIIHQQRYHGWEGVSGYGGHRDDWDDG